MLATAAAARSPSAVIIAAVALLIIFALVLALVARRRQVFVVRVPSSNLGRSRLARGAHHLVHASPTSSDRPRARALLLDAQARVIVHAKQEAGQAAVASSSLFRLAGTTASPPPPPSGSGRRTAAAMSPARRATRAPRPTSPVRQHPVSSGVSRGPGETQDAPTLGGRRARVGRPVGDDDVWERAMANAEAVGWAELPKRSADGYRGGADENDVPKPTSPSPAEDWAVRAMRSFDRSTAKLPPRRSRDGYVG